MKTIADIKPPRAVYVGALPDYHERLVRIAGAKPPKVVKAEVSRATGR